LNIANNNLDEKCGELFEEATRFNTTLIDFEFGFNSFSLEHVSIFPCKNFFVGEEDPR
jgi:hypothetical protein